MKQTAKSAILSISALLIALTILFAFTACSSGVKLDGDGNPKGWEVVTELNDVRYLELKDGGDDYHWKDEALSSDGGNVRLFLDVQIPSNSDKVTLKYDKEGYVDVFIFYGYCLVSEKDGRYEAVEYEGNNDPNAYSLYMGDEMLCTLSGLADQNSVKLDDSGNTTKVGYTKAVKISLPMSEMAGDGSFLFSIEPMGNSGDCASDLLVFDRSYYRLMLADSFEVISDMEALTYPNILYQRFDLINGILMLIAVGLTVLTAVKQWSKSIPLIPCAVGFVYSLLLMFYYNGKSDGMFGGFAYLGAILGLFGTLVVYVILAFILIGVRVIIDRRIAKKAKQ